MAHGIKPETALKIEVAGIATVVLSVVAVLAVALL